MANYESIEKQQMDKAKQQQSQYETERNQQSQAMIDQINQAIDAATRPVQQQYQQQIENVPEQYKKLYSANAVQQMVGRKLLEEQMANMGLTNSGLNRTQQTALTLQRGNADNSVRTQEQAARDELNAALSKLLADAAAQKQQQAAQITNQAASDILGNRTNLFNNAVNAAVEEYNAILQNEIAKQQLAQQQAQLRAEQELKQKQLEQEQARWQAEQELQQKQLELEQANLPERYKQEAVQILLGQGYTYPEAHNMVFGNGAAGSSGGFNGSSNAGGAVSYSGLKAKNGMSVAELVDRVKRQALSGDFDGAIRTLKSNISDQDIINQTLKEMGTSDTNPVVFGTQLHGMLEWKTITPTQAVAYIIDLYGNNNLQYAKAAAKQAGDEVYKELMSRWVD